MSALCQTETYAPHKKQPGNGHGRGCVPTQSSDLSLKTGHRNAAGRHGPTGRNPAAHSLVYFVCGAKALLEEAMANPQSTARIAGHPIHPMLTVTAFVRPFRFELRLPCDMVEASHSPPPYCAIIQQRRPQRI
jgi:hypothetical protein